MLTSFFVYFMPYSMRTTFSFEGVPSIFFFFNTLSVDKLWICSYVVITTNGNWATNIPNRVGIPKINKGVVVFFASKLSKKFFVSLVQFSVQMNFHEKSEKLMNKITRTQVFRCRFSNSLILLFILLFFFFTLKYL